MRARGRDAGGEAHGRWRCGRARYVRSRCGWSRFRRRCARLVAIRAVAATKTPFSAGKRGAGGFEAGLGARVSRLTGVFPRAVFRSRRNAFRTRRNRRFCSAEGEISAGLGRSRKHASMVHANRPLACSPVRCSAFAFRCLPLAYRSYGNGNRNTVGVVYLL